MKTHYMQPKARPEWGTLVRAHRAGAGLTREELCQRSGISNSMLTKVERGDRTPSPQLLLKMAPALGGDFRDAAVRLLVHQYLAEEP